MSLEKTFYFAYGLQMIREDMEKRFPKAESISSGFIQGFEFVFDSEPDSEEPGTANIIQTNHVKVWGGLWNISIDDLLLRLDKSHSNYERIQVTVQASKGLITPAWVYQKKGLTKVKEPKNEYRNKIIKGAYDFQLPDHYIELLSKK